MKNLVRVANELRAMVDSGVISPEAVRETADIIEEYAVLHPVENDVDLKQETIHIPCNCGSYQTTWVEKTVEHMRLRNGIVCERCGQQFYVNPLYHNNDYIYAQWRQITRTGAVCLTKEDVQNYLYVSNRMPDFGKRPLFLERYGQYAHVTQVDFETDAMHNAPWLSMREVFHLLREMPGLYNQAKYLHGWRLWDDRPTYEQVRNMLWDGERLTPDGNGC